MREFSIVLIFISSIILAGAIGGCALSMNSANGPTTINLVVIGAGALILVLACILNVITRIHTDLLADATDSNGTLVGAAAGSRPDEGDTLNDDKEPAT